MVSKSFYPLFFCKIQLLVICFTVASLVSFSQNPIVAENALTGNPKSEWDINSAGDLSIQGFATDISVNKGQTIRFKIDVSPAAAYTIKIYRLGYYNGNGARLIANLGTFNGTPQGNGSYNSSTGLLDCGNWTESASWAVPSNAVSGLYIARLAKTSSSSAASHIVFVVRDDAATADILLKTSDATWQAYNVYGGNSLYVGSTSYPNGHAPKVSYNRPFITRNGGGGGGAMEDWFMNAEYPMIRFLERNGYNISYTTDVDMDRDQTPITPAKYKIVMSSGHDEYWSLNERNRFENARAAGVHLAFFSGNEVYWKTRWENNNRTLVCYKEGTLGENVCGNKCDPTSAWTGLWRDGASYDAGKPENMLSGQISWNDVTSAIKVTGAYKNLRFWRNTSVAKLAATGSVTFTSGTLGYEWDYQQYPNYYPSGQIALSSTTVNGLEHRLSLYRYPGGSLVFGSGTVQWAWGLDNIHDRGSAAASKDMQQATVNLFADMGVQPATLMSTLVAATASTDFTAPTVNITSPVNNGSVTAGTSITVSGNASDAGGVLVGVEVSVDGGVSWKKASGTSAWTYSWTPSLPGAATIQARGFDDSGNMSVPGSSGSSSNINVTINGNTPTCPCSIFPATVSPQLALEQDNQPLEIGVKFRSSVAGYITGIKFWKGGAANNGTHVGHVWSGTGTKLAEANFGSETSSGWQTVNFNTPVAIAANTTYIASYFSPSGYYSTTNPYFTSAVSSGYLTALANGQDGPNGVYLYTSTGGFPTSNYQTANYWVDVVFTTTGGADLTPPIVTGVSPASNATGVAINTTVSATFSEGMDASTITASSVELRDASNTLATASISYNATTKTVTLTPLSALANGVTYTARVRSGATGVKDVAGNALLSDYTWSFITATADLTAPTITSVTPANNATGVSTTSTIVSNFSEALATSSVTGSTFTVRDAGNNIVAGALDVTATRATFTPSTALTVATTYTVTITGGPSGVKDLAGNPLAADYIWSFTTAVPDIIPPVVSSTTPAASAADIAIGTTVTATFSEAMTGGSITTSTVQLRNSANTLVTATISYNASTRVVTLTPSAALAYSTTYTARILGGTSGVKDASGNPLATDFTWSFVTAAAPPLTYTIWPSTATPAAAADNDGTPIEVGVKFRVTQAGYITGIRFYKGAANTGTHIGHIWSTTGTKLAEATFTSETSSGWQQVLFNTPVAVTTGTTYIASYFSSAGYYALTNPYFTKAVTNGPLRALAKGEDGGNGVYKYTSVSAMPNLTYQTSNYWVDVVFATSVTAKTNEQTQIVKTEASSNSQKTSVAESGEIAPPTGFDVKVTPNPGTSFFKLIVFSMDRNPVTVRISDISGKLIESYEKLTPNSQLRMGQRWASGTYFAEVVQGDKRQVVKLIKLK